MEANRITRKTNKVNLQELHENAAEGNKIQEQDLKELRKNEPDHTLDENKTSQASAGVSKEKFEEIRTAFNLFDKDGNGYISASELKHVLTSLGYNLTEAEMMDMMNTIDADGNGAIDFPEFLELTTKKLYISSEAEVARETFQVFDRARKGHIAVDDLRHIFNILGQGFNDEEIRGMVYAADFDHDGVVDFEDFLKMMNLNPSND